MEHNIKIGVTQGDINGTSYEVILKTFQEQHFSDICTPVVYGSPKVSGYYRKALNINTFNFFAANSAAEAQHRKPNMVNVLDDNAKVEIGKSTQLSVEAAMISLNAAITDLSVNNIDAMVLSPVDVANTPDLPMGSQFAYVKQKLGLGSTLTLLVNESVKIALLTDACPLRDAIKSVSIDNIVERLTMLSDALKSDFGIDKPRIAVLGLNPNCAIANPDSVEQSVIKPAVEQACAKDVLAVGPIDADEVFGTSLYTKFDAVLAMYYQQGAVPFRTLDYGNGVSYMIGMSQMCVAPFQSVGFDEVCLDKVSTSAFQCALYLICDVMAQRRQYSELKSNVLQSHTLDD